MAAAALAAIATTSPAAAVTRRATPDTAGDIIAQARGGDTVVLAAGAYNGLRISGSFTPELTIDARAATITGAVLSKASGVTILGGTFHLPPPRPQKTSGQLVFGASLKMDNVERIKVTEANFVGPGGATGPYGEGYGIHANVGADVQVDHNRFQGFKTGVVLTRVKQFKVSRNTTSLMRSDGIQVSKSWKGVIEDNTCASVRVRDAEHPDCIQMWSRPPYPPTSDVVIRGNKASGAMQGIGLFNHARDGVDDGGFDRITIENNDMAVSRPNGITLTDGRNSVIRNNRVSTGPNARWQARIRANGDTKVCGNTTSAGAGRGAITDPKC